MNVLAATHSCLVLPNHVAGMPLPAPLLSDYPLAIPSSFSDMPDSHLRTFAHAVPPACFPLWQTPFVLGAQAAAPHSGL